MKLRKFKPTKARVKRTKRRVKLNMARYRKRARRSYSRTVHRSRSKAKSFLSGTMGKVVIGGVIGAIVPFLANRFAPQTAVLVDDASDLASTFIAGKYGLVGNMIGKRLVPMLIRQGNGANVSGDMA